MSKDHAERLFSSVPPSSSLFPLGVVGSHRFTQLLNLLTLKTSSGLKVDPVQLTLDRVLHDETKYLNLRDLPSFFACANQLLSTFTSLPDQASMIENIFQTPSCEINHTLPESVERSL